MDKHIILTAAVLLLLASISTGCDDLDTQLCIQIGQKYPGICSDSCLSQMCKRTCGLCPVQCYECHEIANPKSCSAVVECPTKDHYCFTTQAFADNFTKVYKLGCATKTLCTDYFGGRIGRGLRVEATCCVDDKCNNMTPEEIENERANHQQPLSLNSTHSTPLPNLIDDCGNIDEGICGRLALLQPSFCHDNICAATKLCPLMCKQCFRCYSCNDISRIENCNTTSTCPHEKKCFSMETLSNDFRPVYRLGCMEMSLCERFKVSPVGIFGKRQDLQLNGGCCDTNLCNHEIHRVPDTTAITTTSSNGCSHYIARQCPPGSHQYNNSCYFIDAKRMSKMEAESFCNIRCAHLADFDTYAHLLSTMRELSSVFHLSLVQGQVNLWTDADINLNFRPQITWKWSSTGSTISSDIINELMRTPKANTHCAAITAVRGSIHYVMQDCSTSYEPLCEIGLAMT